MEGFDREAAIAYIVNELVKEDPSLSKEVCTPIITEIMDTDFEFMSHSGVIVDGHFSPDAYYEEDEAFSYVAERISTRYPKDEQLIMDLLEGYFEYFENYMEQCDLLSWD